jgi:glyoxylate reductase
VGADEIIPRQTLLQNVNCDALLCMVTERIDDELLDHAPQLKIVANMAVGYDNVDVPTLTRRGVLFTNTPGVLTETTADLAFALLLAIARRLGEGERIVREGRWGAWNPFAFLGRDVHHATLGIIGLGRIGAGVAKRAKGFDMHVLYTPGPQHGSRRTTRLHQSRPPTLLRIGLCRGAHLSTPRRGA